MLIPEDKAKKNIDWLIGKVASGCRDVLIRNFTLKPSYAFTDHLPKLG
jgi:hypothetical protein